MEAYKHDIIKDQRNKCEYPNHVDITEFKK